MTTSTAPVERTLIPSVGVARSIVWPLLEERIRGLQPDLSRVCLHHLGLSDADVDGDGDRGGKSKLVRATLVMAAAAGLGVPPQEMGAEATAVELLHNSTLLHDDIIDDDHTRRGSPSAWAKFGVPLAILAGDAMQAAGLHMVLDGHDRQAQSLAEAISQVLAGQAGEQTLRMSPGTAVAQFEQIAVLKTSALLEYCLTVAADRVSAPEATLAALRSAGRHLGIAWQAANDLEDIWGDPGVTGKPARGDLKRRNLTLPVLAAMDGNGDAGARLRELWQLSENTPALLEEMAGLIEDAGGRRTAQQQSRHHLELARDDVDRAGLTAAGRNELRALFHLIVNRTT
jgi:geranylgeranyl diphosphate synthase type I